MSVFEFDDQQGVRTRGTLHAPGATPGDVLTVGTPHGAVSPSPGGGSQPWEVVRVPIAFTTPDLVQTGVSPPAGLALLTVAEGDLVSFGVSTSTAWTATDTPTLHYPYFDGDDPVATALFTPALPQANSPSSSPGLTLLVESPTYDIPFYRAELAGVLKAIVDDGSGGAPFLDAGASEIVILRSPAA